MIKVLKTDKLDMHIIPTVKVSGNSLAFQPDEPEKYEKQQTGIKSYSIDIYNTVCCMIKFFFLVSPAPQKSFNISTKSLASLEIGGSTSDSKADGDSNINSNNQDLKLKGNDKDTLVCVVSR